MKKRILSIILVIAVMLTLVPISVFAAGSAQITIDSTTSTQDNTTWAWDAATNTLTLKGINMSLSSGAGCYGIYITGNGANALTTVNVVVTGENVISGNTGILYGGSSATVNTINFSGTGSLTVSSDQIHSMVLWRTTVNFNSGVYKLSHRSTNNDNVHVIDAGQTTCNFNGATVNMQAAPYGCGYVDSWNNGDPNSNVYINSGSVTINTHGTNIVTSKLVINGGTSDFHIGRSDWNNIGTYGQKATINGGQVKLTGGLGTEQFQNNALNTLALTTLTLSGVSATTAVSSLTTSPDLGYTYGTADMKTDANGVIYAYLPTGKTTATVVAGDNTYTGTITSNAGTLTLLSSLTDISLAPVSIAYADRAAAGTKVADLAATGIPTSGITYSLDGSGANDSLFQIDGTQLQIKSGATLAAQSYTVKVKVTDGTPTNTYTKQITFTANVRPQTYAVSAATNSVNVNGVIATATFGSSPYAAGDTATVTVKLSGTAAAAGTHTIGLISAKAGTITAPTTVTKTVASGATPTDEFLFTFTMPANAVDDLVVTNTFEQVQSIVPAATAATVAKTAATQAAVNFTLTSATIGIWKVYDAAENGGIVNGVTASASSTNLTLTHASNIPAGTYYVSVTEAGKTESTRLALTVGAYIYIAPSITTTSLPSAIAGTPYSQTLAATGDTPFNWAITSGSLPDGLSLGAGSGIISGIPTQTGVYNFGVTVANGPNGNTYYDTKAFSIAVNAPTYSVSAATNAVQSNGVTATATFGETPYTAGAAVSVTITLTGTATTAGTHTIGFTSAKAGVITLPATVTKTVAAGDHPTNTFAFRFTMPANVVDDLVVTNTFVQAQSTAPTVTNATVAKTATTQAAIDFTLDFSIEGTWKVYDAAANGNIVNGVTVSTTGTALTLTHASNVPAGTYYISVTEAGKTESTRLALTVSEYGAQTYAVSAATNEVYANGVTATASFGSSPYAAGDTATVTITLSGTAAATGTHTIGLTSTKAGTITAPTTVTKAVDSGATPTDEFLFTFTMLANAVDDLVVTNTFGQAQSTAPVVTVATVAKTATTQAAIDFTLNSEITGTWKVYDAAVNGSIVNGVTASASGTTLTLTHANNVPANTYYISVTEAGKTESTRLALTVSEYGAPINTMTASALTEFASQTSGYATAPTVQTVTITNTGNQVITLTEPATTNASSNYSIGALSTATLALNGTATFTVQPKTGLAVGKYTENINIVGSNGATSSVLVQFSVSTADNRSGSGSGSGNGNGSGGSVTVTQPVSQGVEITVNGVSQTAATSTTKTVDNRTVTTITVDDSKIKGKLDSESRGSTVVIPFNSNSDVLVGQLNGETIKNMETKEAILEIKSKTVTYTLPAIQINIDRICEQFGTQVALKDIKVSVTIAEPSSDTTRVVEDTANKNNYQIVVKPVEFSITCASVGKTIEVSKFNGYVVRTIAIPDGVDSSKITTGIVLNSDGTFSHVPTTIVKSNGKYFAKINSLTNSTYSVIYNKVAFKDVDAHWAKEAINDMGSRLVIGGIGDNNFEPDRDITRAEFAAIIVKALGLKPGIGNNTFADVKDSAWYSSYVKTALDYNVTSGYDDGNFRPNDKITREQAMTMIARAMNITGLKVEINSDETEKLLAGFGDSVQTSAWAKEGIVSCVKTGIVSGKNGKMLAPKDNITRAEVAVIVRRLLQKSKLI